MTKVNADKRRRTLLLVSLLLTLAAALAGCAANTPRSGREALEVAASGGYGQKIGVDVGGINEREWALIDIAKTLRRWEKVDQSECGGSDESCKYAPLDANGWPTTDARTVFFDVRPFGAWWGYDQANCPFCADGTFQPDMSGTYKLSFKGQAVLGGPEGSVNVQNQRFDTRSNTTTANIVVSEGEGLLSVSFNNTRRTANSATNTGITDLKLIRPGFKANTKKIFNPTFIKALAPFSTLRFMNWAGGNNINPPYGDADNTLEWSERVLPSDRIPQGEGVPWEYIVEVANLAHKNIWINVPIHASDDYIRNLAKFLKKTLHKKATIYVEYSNEVWNFSFTQATYNQLAAQDAVLSNPTSALAVGAPADSELDGRPYNDVWRRRRHVMRLVEISNIFSQVYGERAINDKVRVIYSWQIGYRPVGVQYREALEWLSQVYGPPSRYLYAVAGASYINNEGISEDASVEKILGLLRERSDEAAQDRAELTRVARAFGLEHAMYEGGPDTAGPLQFDRDTGLLLNTIEAHRDPRMKELIIHDIRDNWFEDPAVEGDMFMFFTLQSQYNRWGMWGLTEDVNDLDTPKFQAIRELTAH